MRLSDRIAEGLAALDEAEPLAADAALELELSRLHHLRGNLLFPLGRHADCLREHELARRHAREAGSLEAEAAALGGLGDGFYLQGRMRSAHRQFLDCVALARQHGFGRLEVANLPMVGWSAMHLTEIGAAVAVGHEAIALAQRASQPRAELMARALVAWCDGVLRDRRDEAEEQAELALHLVRVLGAKRFEGQLHGLNAVIALRRGDRQRALELADTGLAVCREHGMGHIGPWLHGVRALAETDPSARRQIPRRRRTAARARLRQPQPHPAARAGDRRVPRAGRLGRGGTELRKDPQLHRRRAPGDVRVHDRPRPGAGALRPRRTRRRAARRAGGVARASRSAPN